MIRESISWRGYLLGMTTLVINLAMVYGILTPQAANRRVANFKFPERLTINAEQEFISIPQTSNSTEITEIAAETEISEVVTAQQQYRIAASPEIELQLNYLVGTRGDVGGYLTHYTDLEDQTIKKKQIKQVSGIGHYALVQDSERLYLSSCINPKGSSTVTTKQFATNRYRYDLRWSNFWSWWQGQSSIRDRRCLWVLLSSPRRESQNLETTWVEIYRWWQPKFPPLVVAQDNELAV